MWVVAGLGNPDPEHAGSRHNVGFAVAEVLASRLGARLRPAAHGAAVARGRLRGVGVLLLTPLTYMNRSGEAVAAWLREAGAEPSALIVAHDDADLALGRIQVRRGGGAAGHRGVASTIAAVGTASFTRVRIGIGRPAAGETMVDHVLAAPGGAAAAALEAAAARAADAIEAVISRGIAAAMTAYNAWPPSEARGPGGGRGEAAGRRAAGGAAPENPMAEEVSARARV
jgi:PTH1 family peptidyl-tRNA hydrolase